ncbi:transcriptional regulator [Sphaerisporangium siamense]|uniref:Transcriptional regulator with XRE-family HTH domain n=1 Tax=Sphaerisporangium siamense TaxID=795645 RepID=A0A7W7G8M4_9ACTN|nr:helix-turn-helix transcriptional regulator [Sphaerisporangium siamense]MBB4700477.1 transcriptional regulator with XRE-family HTH domain [Sphaerisporangium siamense]GII88360.1 transcriptional regulator [Sphaerisporangium siamense]
MAVLSPTVRQRRLVQELRRLRLEAGFSQVEVAQQLDWSESKQIKMERGTIPIRVPDVRAMLDLYGLSVPERHQERDMLLQLARDARQRGWWHSYGDVIPGWFEVYVGLEAESSTLRTYQPELVHGLLQTPDYYRAFMRTSPVADSDEERERKIEVRKARQARLDTTDAPNYWTIMNEAALRRLTGSPVVMKAQLNHILERMTNPKVTVQVLPFATGMHPAMDEPFTIVGFPESADLDVVYLESQTGALYLEDRAQVDRYHQVFDQLRAKALDPVDSRALIEQTVRDL